MMKNSQTLPISNKSAMAITKELSEVASRHNNGFWGFADLSHCFKLLLGTFEKPFFTALAAFQKKL